MSTPTVSPYLATLRRVPDDIILSVATRDIDLFSSFRCVCGWLGREASARTRRMDASDAPYGGLPVSDCRSAFGGERAEWQRINHAYAIIGAVADLELAFADRVAEAAGVR